MARRTLLAALAVAACSEGQAPAVDSLVDAERAFAAMSVAEGTRAAFLANLAEGAVLFQPGPTDGRAYWEAREPSPGTLDWGPEYAHVSLAGDLGLSTGPWRFTAPGMDRAVHGYFVSLWRRDDRGTWQVELDHGTTNPPPADTTAPATVSQPDSALFLSGPPDLTGLEGGLLAEDARLAEAASDDPDAAYRLAGSSAIRFYRNGSPPVTGVAAATDWLTANGGTFGFETVGHGIAGSGDLGYTYGTADRNDGQVAFVRVWWLEQPGRWRLALDLEVPVR